jgi:hypothetical protein
MDFGGGADTSSMSDFGDALVIDLLGVILAL